MRIIGEELTSAVEDTLPTFAVLEAFIKLGIAPEIIEALSAQGYTQPTPIQEQAIPAALNHQDVLGTAQTGTGKTAAFSIPIIQNLMGDAGRGKGIKALILTPTRELALQIDESIEAYGANVRLKHAVIFGGVGQQPQVDAIKRGVDIMTATPGRLLDLMQQGYIDLRQVQFFVLDEADRMLDMGFIHDVKKVIAKLPTARQTLFFSATMPSEVVKLSQNILVDPVRVSVAPVSTTAEKVSQSVFYVDQKNKRFLLRHLLDTSAEDIPSVLVFTRTKHGADKVVKDLVKLKITAQAIHGNKSQTARQSALANFKNRTTRVLVATDIAARGIDIDELTHVINYEIPNIPETYVHRIGRTGRAGNSGVAWSFVDREEVPYLRDIQKLIKMEIPVTAEHPFLPGTHVAEANDAKPFYNQSNFNEGKGRNSGGQSGRNDSRNGGGQGGHNRNQGQNRSQGSGRHRGFNRNQERDRNQGSDRNRESQPRDPETRTEPAKPAGLPKPFTRFKPRE